MTNTAIIGVGMTPVSEHWGVSLRELAAEAAIQALQDAGVQRPDVVYVANAYGSTFNSQAHLGALIADFLNLTGVEAYTIEAGDASGGAALRAAHLAVASGDVRTALVIGVEKATDIVASARVAARNISLDADYESRHGATLPAMAALLMRRYMYEFGVELGAFEGFSLNAHLNGSLNANAMYRNKLRAGAFAKAPMVAEPVSLFDGAPDGDGAAAVVIASAESAPDLSPQPIYIKGSAAATDAFMIQERADMLSFSAVAASTEKALHQAGASINDMSLYELNDAFTIMTALSLEAMGLAERGAGWQLAGNEGADLGLTGKLPISTFGGMKSRGNPAGAAGVYQAVEASLQLRGSAVDNQVQGASKALIQNLGGLASTAVTHILTVDGTS
ncbi:thiolase domain-containing protein [Phototrophicus methaneseepsis]|uniref:Thiolase domain-containing protein n=1 Tax=Phototrophicus methaneseepsis TaxID=2710758 RepID=A0A7S8E6H7_9CHLR|nr:beta-ketoacyl synthase N-terminal-like domain-containing protein [Phototrophicus methaneseepsis]QPC81250.1 thiolase domain-containing protein [Phototrophicus methaneseepsis]